MSSASAAAAPQPPLSASSAASSASAAIADITSSATLQPLPAGLAQIPQHAQPLQSHPLGLHFASVPMVEKKKYVYQSEIRQMMYVFGEVQDPLEDTVELVEDIVQSQLCEILAQAASHALKRGTRFINVEDLIFLIRKDTQKVNRLKIFLSWKDVRKAQGKDSSGGADTAEDLLEEGAGDKPLKVKRMKIKFSWDLIQQYSSLLSDDEDEDEDEEELEAYEDQIQRLKTADDVTKTMSKDQYIYYADCRQASFTFKKVKKFREFCMMSNYCENRTNNEVMDVLGFLAYELVSKLTEVGLHVRKEWAQSKPADGDGPRIPDLFAGPPPEISPLQPVHIQEAFRRLQRPSKCMDSFRSGLQRTMVSLI